MEKNTVEYNDGKHTYRLERDKDYLTQRCMIDVYRDKKFIGTYYNSIMKEDITYKTFKLTNFKRWLKMMKEDEKI